MFLEADRKAPVVRSELASALLLGAAALLGACSYPLNQAEVIIQEQFGQHPEARQKGADQQGLSSPA